MKIEEVKKIIDAKMGMRFKYGEDDSVIVYANCFTLIADIFKWIRKKLNNFIFYIRCQALAQTLFINLIY